MDKDKKIKPISRREMLYWSLPVAGAAVIVFSFGTIYSGAVSRFLRTNTGFSPRKKYGGTKGSDGEGRSQNILLNTKTGVLHYPSSRIFKGYDQIAKKNEAAFGFKNWFEKISRPDYHFNKAKSGIMLETLALRELEEPLTAQKYQSATLVVTEAFSEKYRNKRTNGYSNIHNWRLYDILVQLIALNTSIPFSEKINTFNRYVNNIPVGNSRVPKRNDWLLSREGIQQKLEYITRNKEKYEEKLLKRRGRIFG